ncbi:hypothetical protein DBR11_07490 [Pedobacter sp. HMWF019]|uniref:prepilin-type N-terminal cleavage/methylation domain-containing protein n=1 Tax=Pedobacter sp. HMWF019 TaxID=2056856 RepID=UPI000D33E0C5|nr:prepilin-type N-terminal cleavage/methylation domain-containing protein [Pedobacter sp. HMWF019]PTT01384.1 hypothetical protein DBR11_07490 [Pedobacter sp. HMWF019]
MRLNKKVSAFTLMEVTIAMLIAAIAIAITYTAYRIVSRSYLDYKRKQEKTADLMAIDQRLRNDFESAKTITRSPQGIIIEQSGGKINYVFSKDVIIRDQFSLRTDSFKMSLDNIHYLFERQDKETGAILDELGLSIHADGQPMPLSYKKQYSSQDLFEFYAGN